jgi:hypothetical protein
LSAALFLTEAQYTTQKLLWKMDGGFNDRLFDPF